MKNSKKVGIVIAASVAALMLAGCAQQNPNAGSSSGVYGANSHHGSTAKSNSCKGNACKGRASCKGKSGCSGKK